MCVCLIVYIYIYMYVYNICIYIYVVVYTYTGWWYTYPSKRYELLSWDDDIPMEQNEVHVPNNKPGCHGAAVLHEVFFSHVFLHQVARYHG